ncbi:thiamine phosphate synthase [Flavobacterium rhamnosiphilum]|uniref:Thiamine phosphate synthase n=1 Tax=Flavobacterium rhamnosiphilum TaxID=2541724 RepID=A0A4R5FD01_9FLAO|nr:thiamine phosphate synthase [Flavobacterium rhamnosiphilum]TDE47001.1 thiamine phosphate synthase [Flavobacterium rhamnosiphilum]
MILISNPISVPNEISLIHSLFAEGLELLHVRKPDFSETEMKAFLSEIGLEFRTKLVLHNHHHLADELNINRFHFSEKERTNPFRVSNLERIISTATHSIEDFNALENDFEYAFLSPIYPSISKPDYVSKINYLEEIKNRINFSTKLVALGGISAENIQQTLANGFDDIALLGTIWNSNNPIENFKLCQQIALSY